MPTNNLRILFAASLNVALAAQAPAVSQTPQTELSSALAGGGGYDADPTEWRTLRARPQQDEGTDYSLRTLFQQDHGDFMQKRERFDPQVMLRGGMVMNGSIGSNDGDFDLYRGTADLDFRILVAHNAYFTLGGFYDQRSYETNSTPQFRSETLFATGANIGFGWFVAEDVLLEAKAKPGYWSDLDSATTSDDFDCWASALATVRYSQEFFFKLGARYNEVYEQANVLPSLGMTWAGETVRVDILLPDYFEVSLWPSPDFGFLFGAEVQGGEYNVRGPRNAGSDRSTATVRVQEVLAYTGVHWQFTDEIGLVVRGGAALTGDYSLDDGNASTVQNLEGTLDPCFFFDVSVGILF
jgi:hypothetical protein